MTSPFEAIDKKIDEGDSRYKAIAIMIPLTKAIEAYPMLDRDYISIASMLEFLTGYTIVMCIGKGISISDGIKFIRRGNVNTNMMPVFDILVEENSGDITQVELWERYIRPFIHENKIEYILGHKDVMMNRMKDVGDTIISQAV